MRASSPEQFARIESTVGNIVAGLCSWTHGCSRPSLRKQMAKMGNVFLVFLEAAKGPLCCPTAKSKALCSHATPWQHRFTATSHTCCFLRGPQRSAEGDVLRGAVLHMHETLTKKCRCQVKQMTTRCSHHTRHEWKPETLMHWSCCPTTRTKTLAGELPNSKCNERQGWRSTKAVDLEH